MQLSIHLSRNIGKIAKTDLIAIYQYVVTS